MSQSVLFGHDGKYYEPLICWVLASPGVVSTMLGGVFMLTTLEAEILTLFDAQHEMHEANHGGGSSCRLMRPGSTLPLRSLLPP